MKVPRRRMGVGSNGGGVGGFSRFARAVSRASGRGATIAIATGTVVAWALAGPMLGFSQTWQLAINTLTTIVTFLMVFIIQNTQNRDTEAMQIKLDELLRANRRASNAMIDLEDEPDRELTRLQKGYARLAATARQKQAPVGNLKHERQTERAPRRSLQPERHRQSARTRRGLGRHADARARVGR